MRVFVTGATGFVGSAVVKELISAGHEVIGLARSDTGAAALKTAGADVERGTLEDHTSLRQGASDADGVIHIAFNHDFSRFAENSEVDRLAIETLGTVLAGSKRPLLVTAGVPFAPGRVATEDDVPPPRSDTYPRVSDAAARALASRGVNASVIRLPQVHGEVNGEGKAGFVSVLIALAREKGVAAYVGDGSNRWPAVHVRDAANLYRLALEQATPWRYHAIAEEGVPLREIANVVGRRLRVPVKSIAPEEAANYFGWFGGFAAMDAASSSAQTRARTGWHPTGISLLADLEHESFYLA